MSFLIGGFGPWTAIVYFQVVLAGFTYFLVARPRSAFNFFLGVVSPSSQVRILVGGFWPWGRQGVVSGPRSTETAPPKTDIVDPLRR